jgi:hypothetical protein
MVDNVVIGLFFTRLPINESRIPNENQEGYSNRIGLTLQLLEGWETK